MALIDLVMDSIENNRKYNSQGAVQMGIVLREIADEVAALTDAESITALEAAIDAVADLVDPS